ncbi:MAG: hypothetical protein MJ197_10535 [Bacteroidales bacterium]|nr:hypothetical protein [Bacteroidales bacterium]
MNDKDKILSARDLYKVSADFKDYVDSYARKHNEGNSIPVDEALEHLVVRAYAEIMQKGGMK